MSTEPVVQLLEIELLGDNPALYTQALRWRMRLESLYPLQEPISVAFVWVGSASSAAYDQVLDAFDVGPLAKGATEFTMECDPPRAELVPPAELLGVTILVISFQYRGQEFLRVGYYTQVAYFDPHLNQLPPPHPQEDLLGRFIAMPRPTVTVTPIAWDKETGN
ncbi:Histone chaperone ASF1-like [Trypanosoma melophagium]|uniref:Histone chaperone ASF1-like n=1 Tax=Trypanosoma melophagium TaxID=715481 RepID=UPI00351A17FA|nr:Histone chaperone ASF1-like [Trypanosoma melophagium]